MARPKTIRKPSKRAQARRAKKELRLKSPGFVFLSSGADTFYPVITGAGGTSGAGGNVTVTGTGWTSTTSATSSALTITGGSGFRMEPRQVAIESLDEGVTWHTTDSMEPCARIGDDLVIATNPSGRAPECMRAGSGTYRFEITVRSATDEEARAWGTDREHREIELARTWREEAESIEKAGVRARELLLSHLTASQRRDLETSDGFWVTSQFGNRYWVTRRTAVRFDDRGAALQRYCIHAVDPKIPPDDNALARMLLLKCDEERFLGTANPGPPSEWDVGRRETAFINPAQDGQVIVTGGTTTGNGGSVVVAAGQYYVPALAAPPVEPCTALVPVGPEPCTAMVPVAPDDRIIRVEAEVEPEPEEIPEVNLHLSAGPRLYVTAPRLSIYPILLWVNGIVRPLCG